MYKRILVPIDGSATSNKALVAALQLAKDSGGRVRLIHVVEELAYLSGYEQFGGYSGELITVMREAGTKILNDGMGMAKAAGIEADNMLFDNFGGRLAEVVADAAKQWNADLVFFLTKLIIFVFIMLLGSGAEQIIRLASAPVLVVRSGEDSALKSG
jgi:nucleotide-binding universal stress UspA family protein